MFLEVSTLGAESRDGACGVFDIGPEPERGEAAQGPNGMGGFLPTPPHEEALQLVRVDLLEVPSRLRRQLQPDVLQTLRCRQSLVL